MSLEDVQLFGDGAQEHWYESYEILHAEQPVLKLKGEGITPDTDAYVLTKYEDISRVVKDLDRYPGTLNQLAEDIRNGATLPEALKEIDVMVQSVASLRYNQELWRAHRRELTDPWIGPSGTSRHQKMIEQHAHTLIDQWIDKPEVDFVSQFARPLPQRVMATILGFPLEDIPKLAEWGDAQVMDYVYGQGHKGILSPEQTQKKFKELDGFRDYVADIVKMKRADPQDDMISYLSTVEYQALGRKLTELEINGIVYAMVLGGLETTQYAIEEQAQLLCDKPDLFQRLKKDRSLIRQFTEEAMRLRSPTQGLTTRITTQDEEFQGVKVPKGSLLHMRYAAANVDPEEFDCPYELQMDRKSSARHLAFSAGVRVCPGASISRLEQITAWNCLFDRLDHIEYGRDNDFKHQPGLMLGTLKLNLKFQKAV